MTDPIQQGDPIQEGDTVKWEEADQWLSGVVQQQDGDTLIVRATDGDEHTVGRDSAIRTFEGGA